MVLSTEWSQVEVIDLTNDGNGLGFILVGGRSTGVVIKALIPGGIAERDGRLQSGDHVLQIGNVNLRGFNSEQVATVLRQTGGQVRLIVARPIEPTSQEYQSLVNHAPIIPTKYLADPDELARHLYENPNINASGSFINSPSNDLQSTFPLSLDTNNIIDINSGNDNNSLIKSQSIDPIESFESNYIELPETETYNVELRKNVYGLGITVAGYVCEEEDLSGIFVKSIIEGSAAETSGRIKINDRIVAVDGNTLSGVTNYQAVEILRNTGIIVNLTLERFLRGRKYEHLQVALTDNKSEIQSQESIEQSPSIATLSWVLHKSDIDSIGTDDFNDDQIEQELILYSPADSNISISLDKSNDSIDMDEIKKDGNGNIDENCDSNNSISQNSECNTPTPMQNLDPLVIAWMKECPDSEIISTEINKLSGLGISLEGTVDVEGGIEKRPHHYIRAILEDGPIAKNGLLKPGDELLQVNELKLQGLQHIDVVQILKQLPAKVKLVCARGPKAPSIINTSQNAEGFESRSLLPGGHQCLQNITKAQSESSLYTSSTATLTDQQRSKSVEQISGLALWSNEIVFVDIEKTDKGFGFSILDYQDPLNPEGTVIVIRGLIPGGSAERTNLIFPGDRLVSVANDNLDGLILDDAVNILKSMPNGITKIGICRPLATSDSNIASPGDSSST